jgi:transposase
MLRPDLHDPRFNDGYEDLAHHYGFLIDRARARKPTDKPKIEREIPLRCADFWLARIFSSLAESNGAFEEWCLEGCERVYGTTREPPLTVFRLVEQPAAIARRPPTGWH